MKVSPSLVQTDKDAMKKYQIRQKQIDSAIKKYDKKPVKKETSEAEAKAKTEAEAKAEAEAEA